LALVAVVSGRPAEFLADRLELAGHGSRLRAIGLHGLEEAFPDGSLRPLDGVAAWRPEIEAARDQLLAGVPNGVRVEDKGYGVTVHWRSAGAPGDGIEAIAARTAEVAGTVAAGHGLVPRPGKSSVELVLPLGVNKGTVVKGLCGGLERACYLGDDAADLLAFSALDELSASSGLLALKIAVAGAEVPDGLLAAADLVLAGPDAGVAFLAALDRRLRPS
jgi:trehalose 6-phosphate phosphatase